MFFAGNNNVIPREITSQIIFAAKTKIKLMRICHFFADFGKRLAKSTEICYNSGGMT